MTLDTALQAGFMRERIKLDIIKDFCSANDTFKIVRRQVTRLWRKYLQKDIWERTVIENMQRTCKTHLQENEKPNFKMGKGCEHMRHQRYRDGK